MADQIQETLTSLPHAPGIYIYRNHEGVVLYVGKAIDLSKRVHQYFQRGRLDEKTRQLVSQIASIETQVVESEFEALLLEAKTIRQYLPKYNIIAKDDKSPIYVTISATDELPRISLVRKRVLGKIDTAQHFTFGPFPSATFLRGILKQIRTIVPYCTQKERNGRACFYTHIGLCDPCASVIAGMSDGAEKRNIMSRYRTQIRMIVRIFSGESRKLLREMEREMQGLAEKQDFEGAQRVKLQRDHLIRLLGRRFDPAGSVSRMNPVESTGAPAQLAALRKILSAYYPQIRQLGRIECMDISNLGTSVAVGSLVVLTEGMPDSAWYRRFRIKTVAGQNDFAMMAEVVRRRFGHPEWPTPDLFIVDGGRGQVSSAVEVLQELGVDMPIIGLAKRFESIIVPTTGGVKAISLPLTHPAIAVLQRIRDEAHRFAITYQRLLSGKRLLGK